MKSRCFVAVLAAFFLTNANSADYAPWTVPTYAEVVSGGIAVYDAFGNENGCTRENIVLYLNTYSDYDVVVSMVLAAITAQRELRFYTNQCVTFIFHGGTVNQSIDGHAIYFR